MKGQLEILVGQMIEKGVLYSEARAEFERTFFRGVLERSGGNQSKAAQMLGIHRNTLGRRIEELGLNNHSKRHKRTGR
ncbi:MAG TPA: helix-turn-helix domain-containing protein [Terriglobia bacterium]|nr:helix-turn-helix domain-containing protein [Terriglobia bacterium]